MNAPKLIVASTLTLMLTASACGDGGGDSQSPPPVTVSTLAYVVTECRVERGGGTIRQRLEVRQGDRPTITVADTPAVTTILAGLCIGDAAFNRRGPAFAEIGVFHRLGVTPDGSQVIFEVTDEDIGTIFPPGALTAEQKGIFAVRVDGVLQLTNFRRRDTYTPTASADGERVLFAASTNELGTNPTENCQIFSIDRNGDDLRQLTDFQEAEVHSSNGCGFGRPPLGCAALFVGRDSQSGAVVFYSSCDPFGTNAFGGNLFAMREDGTGLRQLTYTQGYVRESSGSGTVELPYPFAWPGFDIRGQI